jgi:hypothetical protein
MHKNYFLVSLALMLLTACGASVSQGPANDRGLIDMNRELSALPTGGPSPYGSAYGAHQGDRTTLASVDIDRYLKPEARAAKRAPAVAKQTAPVLAKAAPQVAQEPVVPSAPEQLAVAQVTAPPADNDAERYAAREQQPKSQALENYKAGDAVVITSGALIVILLVVILVLLLT